MMRGFSKVLWLGAALAALSFGATSASAATFCVNTTGAGGCATKIQDAINLAAGAGDVIAIAAGVYSTDTLPILVTGAVHDGLKIVGPQTAIIDPNYRVGGKTGATFQIDSNTVSVTGLTFRNGPGNAIDVYGTGFTGANNGAVKVSKIDATGGDGVIADATATGVTVQSNTMAFIGGNWGVDINGDGAKVLSNKITNTYSSGIYVGGLNAVVQHNLLTSIWSTAIYVSGNAANVSYNRVVGAGDTGIYVAGSTPQVNYNTLSNVNLLGIDVVGATAVVTHNAVTSTSSTGIYVQGDSAIASYNRVTPCSTCYGIYLTNGNTQTAQYNAVTGGSSAIYVNTGDTPTVTNNTVHDSLSDGVFVDCTTYPSAVTSQCTAGNVNFNRVTHTAYANGIEVDTYQQTGGLNVLSNTVTGANNSCFGLYQGGTSTAGMTITGNHATTCGSPGSSYAGFDISGDLHALTSNSATSTGGDGFYIAGASNTLTSNTSSFARGQGFAIHGNGTTLTTNHALSFTGSGFAVYTAVTGTTMTGNTVVNPGIVGACFAVGVTPPAAGTNNFQSFTGQTGPPLIPQPTDCTRTYGFE